MGRRARLEKPSEAREMKCAPWRQGLEAAGRGAPEGRRASEEPAARGCPHPSPALHTKGPRVPASC